MNLRLEKNGHGPHDSEASINTSGGKPRPRRILYHAWGIVGYDYLRTEYIGGKIIFHIDHKSSKLRCPICRSRNIILRGTKPRYIRGIPVGHKEVWFALAVQWIECQDCQHLGQVRLGFADPQVSYSRGFERYALELLQMTTITDVAQC